MTILGVNGIEDTTLGGTRYMLYTDFMYVQDGAPQQDLDVYLPNGVAPEGGWPLVVYAHGGGFVEGDKQINRAGDSYALLALDNGFALASINYRMPEGIGPGRLTPEQLATELADVQAAVRWLVAHADELGINPDQLAFYGPSAGGALLAAAAIRANDEGQPQPMGMISVASATHVTNAAAYLDGEDPPFYVIHGTADSIVSFAHAEAFVEALQTAGVPCVFEAVEGGEHTRPNDHPNTMTLLEEQGKINDAYDWLKGLLAE